MTSTFFTDMVQAVEDYAEANVRIEITDVFIKDQALNTNETMEAKVQVINNGALNMTNVILKITALNGAQVAHGSLGADFEDEIFTTPIPKIRGHGGSELTVDDPFVIKAPPTPGLQNIFQVTLHGHDYNLDHITDGHSDPDDTVKDTYTTDVAPS